MGERSSFFYKKTPPFHFLPTGLGSDIVARSKRLSQHSWQHYASWVVHELPTTMHIYVAETHDDEKLAELETIVCDERKLLNLGNNRLVQTHETNWLVCAYWALHHCGSF